MNTYKFKVGDIVRSGDKDIDLFVIQRAHSGFNNAKRYVGLSIAGCSVSAYERDLRAASEDDIKRFKFKIN